MAKSQSKKRWSGTRRRRWTETEAKQVLAAQERSGLPPNRFAAEQGIDPERLRRWRRRLETTQHRRSSTRARGVGFTEVAVSGDRVLPVQALTDLELVLRSGHIVRVGRGFDVQALRQLLRVLAEVGG